jgi:DNA-binding NtrC family response regulator
MALHRNRVLIVDDNSAVREAVGTYARDAGYDVSLAGSGAEALAALQASPRVDVVIADIVMSGMSGFDLAGRVKAIDPTIAMVLMTGYADYVDAVVNIGAVPMLKPFTSSTLSRVLEESLDATREAKRTTN